MGSEICLGEPCNAGALANAGVGCERMPRRFSRHGVSVSGDMGGGPAGRRALGSGQRAHVCAERGCRCTTGGGVGGRAKT